MIIVEYLTDENKNPFAEWFDGLNPQAAAKVNTALVRIEMGNLSHVKSVGLGVFEFRIDWGPGYRIYFAKDGERLIILLAGGTKRRQQSDISDAIARWQSYKSNKKDK
jgi:putative addiction module killer protein